MKMNSKLTESGNLACKLLRIPSTSVLQASLELAANS